MYYLSLLIWAHEKYGITIQKSNNVVWFSLIIIHSKAPWITEVLLLIMIWPSLATLPYCGKTITWRLTKEMFQLLLSLNISCTLLDIITWQSDKPELFSRRKWYWVDNYVHHIPILQKAVTSRDSLEHYYGLNCVPKIHSVEFLPPVCENGALFGNGVSAEIFS